ncbi:hypothetical protein ACVR05_06695 [Streptococcus caprae]|uniref:Uncharacterized protein n=1 Tax=Streptococcus caprae TaxID=1640501 RepID=A0ABV8CVW6_9STRE
MGRIIISRELSFFRARQVVRVYADGKRVRNLYSEGEIKTLPIEHDRVEVQVKEWGLKSKPVTVKDGQTVLIYPKMSLVWTYYVLMIAWFALCYWWFTTHPWPIEDWDSPWRYWYTVAMSFSFWVPAWIVRYLPIFTTSVTDDFPSGYLPS